MFSFTAASVAHGLKLNLRMTWVCHSEKRALSCRKFPSRERWANHVQLFVSWQLVAIVVVFVCDNLLLFSSLRFGSAKT
jgi:hypothetical protein